LHIATLPSISVVAPLATKPGSRLVVAALANEVLEVYDPATHTSPLRSATSHAPAAFGATSCTKCARRRVYVGGIDGRRVSHHLLHLQR